MVTKGEVATIGRTSALGEVRSAHWKEATPKLGPERAFPTTDHEAVFQVGAECRDSLVCPVRLSTSQNKSVKATPAVMRW
jgi:hypothetical protein